MNKQFIIELKGFLKQTFFISLPFSLSVYVFVRLIFSSAAIHAMEDMVLLVKAVATGWGLVTACKAGFEGLVLVLGYAAGLFQEHFKREEKTTLAFEQEGLSLAQ